MELAVADGMLSCKMMLDPLIQGFDNKALATLGIIVHFDDQWGTFGRSVHKCTVAPHGCSEEADQMSRVSTQCSDEDVSCLGFFDDMRNGPCAGEPAVFHLGRRNIAQTNGNDDEHHQCRDRERNDKGNTFTLDDGHSLTYPVRFSRFNHFLGRGGK